MDGFCGKLNRRLTVSRSRRAGQDDDPPASAILPLAHWASTCPAPSSQLSSPLCETIERRLAGTYSAWCGPGRPPPHPSLPAASIQRCDCAELVFQLALLRGHQVLPPVQQTDFASSFCAPGFQFAVQQRTKRFALAGGQISGLVLCSNPPVVNHAQTAPLTLTAHAICETKFPEASGAGNDLTSRREPHQFVLQRVKGGNSTNVARIWSITK